MTQSPRARPGTRNVSPSVHLPSFQVSVAGWEPDTASESRSSLPPPSVPLSGRGPQVLCSRVPPGASPDSVPYATTSISPAPTLPAHSHHLPWGGAGLPTALHICVVPLVGSAPGPACASPGAQTLFQTASTSPATDVSPCDRGVDSALRLLPRLSLDPSTPTQALESAAVPSVQRRGSCPWPRGRFLNRSPEHLFREIISSFVLFVVERNFILSVLRVKIDPSSLPLKKVSKFPAHLAPVRSPHAHVLTAHTGAVQSRPGSRSRPRSGPPACGYGIFDVCWSEVDGFRAMRLPRFSWIIASVF